MRDPIPSFDVAPLIYEASQKIMLHEALQELGLQQDVKILEVEGFRWTLGYEQSPDHPDFQKNMLKLEAKLQEKTRRPIDLRLGQKKDKNNRSGRNVLWKVKPNE